MREPPPKGSLRESLLILLQLKKEYIEYARLRALAQSIIDREKGPEAFDDFKKVALPWVETQKQREQAETIKFLQEEIKRGAFTVTPHLMPNAAVRSRLKTKVVEADSREVDPALRKALSKKIGAIVPR